MSRGDAELQDRADIFEFDDRLIVAIADGAGGMAYGAAAAETFIYNVHEACAHLTTSGQCRRLLFQIDSLLASGGNSGETTGIVAVITPNILFGASAGDSGARIYRGDGVEHVTPMSNSKPFLGSGDALVSEFTTAMKGTLVIATDGLWKYAKSIDIATKVSTVAPEKLASALANLPRLKSAGLPDDIAVVTCRFDP